MRLANFVSVVTVSALALGIAACGDDVEKTADGLTKVSVVLPWVVQGESAGHFVAKELGFYEDEGLEVEILPGGPDVSGTKLLASGSVDFAVAPSASVLTARAQGIPVVSLFTQNQEDGLTFVCKKEHGIDSWEDLPSHKVGVWVGFSDTTLYYAMKLAGVDAQDVTVLPQKFSMAEFFADKFDCASAMVWNELHVVLDEGYTMDDLTILKVSDLGEFLPGDSGVTTEEMLKEHPDVVQGFVNATLRGWLYAMEHPEEAADITVKYAPELDRDAQLTQVNEVVKLMTAGAAADEGRIGVQDPANWGSVQTALLQAGQLQEPQDLEAARTDAIWDEVPSEYIAFDPESD